MLAIQSKVFAYTAHIAISFASIIATGLIIFALGCAANGHQYDTEGMNALVKQVINSNAQ